jgi:hypothetical protein
MVQYIVAVFYNQAVLPPIVKYKYYLVNHGSNAQSIITLADPCVSPPIVWLDAADLSSIDPSTRLFNLSRLVFHIYMTLRKATQTPVSDEAAE